MSLGPDILKILHRQYAPSSFIERRYQRFHLGFKTDDKGRPVLLFMGSKDRSGAIRGRRYARRLVEDGHGNVIKDHWDDKGPAT